MATISVIETEEAFAALQERWEQLVAGNPSARIFQTFSWCYAAWTVYHVKHDVGGRLYILHVARESHDEEAILPLWIDRAGTLRFIGDSISDVCDAVCRAHEGYWHQLYADTALFLNEQHGFQRIKLIHLLPSSELMIYFNVYCPDVRLFGMDACSFIALPQKESLLDALTYLSAKDRSRVRALGRKADNYSHRILSKAHRDAFPTEIVIGLRDEMCKRKMRVYAFFPDEMVTFVRSVYDSGLCEIVVSWQYDAPVAASFRLLCGDSVNFWVMLYLDSMLTTLQYVVYLKEKVREGDHLYDFGTGAYAYKLGTFRPQVLPLFCLESAPLTLGRITADFRCTFRAYLKFKVKSFGLMPLMRFLHLAH